jgi:hypothetical protein
MRHEEVSCAREQPELSLFRSYMTSVRSRLQEPRVVRIYACALRIPRDPERRFKFEDDGFDVNTECAPPKPSACL